MRMKLYEAAIVSATGKQTRAVVAPSIDRVSEFIRDHFHQTGERLTRIDTKRIDTRLKGRDRLRLDDLLETAPVCFAVFVPAVGWLPDHTAVTPFRLFKIEEREGRETLVVAQNADMASAVWGASFELEEGETRMFRILDGTTDLTEHQRNLLAKVLEFGPVGVATWNEGEGWMVRPPA